MTVARRMRGAREREGERERGRSREGERERREVGGGCGRAGIQYGCMKDECRCETSYETDRERVAVREDVRHDARDVRLRDH